jgi:hypothetical protein
LHNLSLLQPLKLTFNKDLGWRGQKFSWSLLVFLCEWSGQIEDHH